MVFITDWKDKLTFAALTGSMTSNVGDTGFKNWRHISKFDASPELAVNNVRSRASARKTGAGIWASNLRRRFLERVSRA